MAAEGFAQIPNWLIRETDLSIYGIAVYAALSSHNGRGGIYPSIPKLAQEARCSERSVQKALAELRALGVLRVERRKRVAGDSDTNVYHLLNSVESSPESGAHGAGGGAHHAPGVVHTVHQGGAHHAPKEEPLEEEPIEEEPPKAPKGAVSVANHFDVFWSMYPRKVGKPQARGAYLKALKREAEAVIIGAVERMLADPNLPEQQFIPHPSTWLNRDGWNDEPFPARGGAAPKPSPAQHAADIARMGRELGMAQRGDAALFGGPKGLEA